MVEKLQAVRREYDRLAPDYDRRWRSYIEATLRSVVEAAQFDGSERILDVACGTGELERRLLARWPTLGITGADVSAKMLQQAQAKDPARQVGWIEADASRLPVPDETFDVVLCANSFHYFRSPRDSLREMHRVLRPGGSLMLVDWCDDYLTCKLCSWWLRWRDPAFYRTYTLRGCRSLLEDAGFRMESADRFRINWLWGMMRLVCGRMDETPDRMNHVFRPGVPSR